MSATTILSICWVLAFFGFEAVLRRRDAETATWTAGDDDRSSTALILGAYLLVIGVNVIAGMASNDTLAATWRWTGVVAIALGLALRAWAMGTLGRYYTRTLRTVDDQAIVDGGPYRLVRHPGYSGSLLIWIGYALGLGSALAAVITAGVLVTVYVWRINAEEALLRSSFGERYVAYQRRTRRLIPFVY